MNEDREVWTILEQPSKVGFSVFAVVLAAIALFVAGVLFLLVGWSCWNEFFGGPIGVFNMYEARKIESNLWTWSMSFTLAATVLAAPAIRLNWRKRPTSKIAAAAGRFSRLAFLVIALVWVVISAWVIYLMRP